MELIIGINDVLICIYLAVIFFGLIELKYSRKATAIVAVIFIIAAFVLYYKLITSGRDESLAAAVAFSIPSLLLCFILSKNKDGRFVFTFCSVDIMGLIIVSISRAIAILFNDNQIIIFLLSNFGFVILLVLSFKIRKRYIQIQKTISSGWRSFGAISVLFYAMMYLITSYPTPMKERREYLPVLFVFIAIIILVYIVIYQAVMKAIKIHDEEKDKELLETKIALQNSQLELKEVYFRMAYTDAITGLKSRTAFEEKKQALIEEIENTKLLSCLMLDLNNLKETNDSFGHSIGDELIINFSDILKSTFCNIDTIYRIGGDEFIILFLETPTEQIEEQIVELKQKILEKNKQNSIQISFAMGLASIEEEAITDIDSLMSYADQRMYENKKQTKKQA